MHIIENIFDEKYSDYLLRSLKNDNSWAFNPISSYVNQFINLDSLQFKKIKEFGQMVNVIKHFDEYKNDLQLSLFDYLANILSLRSSSIKRIKANLLFPYENYTNDNFMLPHFDSVDSNDVTAVVYLNDINDGDTGYTFLFHERATLESLETIKFLSECKDWSMIERYLNLLNDLNLKIKIKPKKNSVFLFPSNYYHCGAYSKYTHRYIINYLIDGNDFSEDHRKIIFDDRLIYN